MKSKFDKGAVLFILYALWHGLLIDALVESSANIVVLIVSAVGILAIDLYLFFSNYRKTEDNKKVEELKYQLECYKDKEERLSKDICSYEDRLFKLLDENDNLRQEIYNLKKKE